MQQYLFYRYMKFHSVWTPFYFLYRIVHFVFHSNFLLWMHICSSNWIHLWKKYVLNWKQSNLTILYASFLIGARALYSTLQSISFGLARAIEYIERDLALIRCMRFWDRIKSPSKLWAYTLFQRDRIRSKLLQCNGNART